jgi:hypothetical protein
VGEVPLKRTIFFAGFLFFTSFITTANAQQMDYAFGFSTIHSKPVTTTSNVPFPPVSLTGGLYPSISGDFMLRKNFGVGGEISWRGGRGNYDASQPYRPIFWDFNAMFVPNLGPRAAAEFSAGIGAESTRFYTPFLNCNAFSCTNYATSTHFMGHFGGGLKLYARGGLFVRPEVHLYIVNNNVEYTSPYVVRYGASIGYTFGR